MLVVRASSNALDTSGADAMLARHDGKLAPDAEVLVPGTIRFVDTRGARAMGQAQAPTSWAVPMSHRAD